MRGFRNSGLLSIVGLVLIGVLAVVLSIAALRSTAPIEAEPAPHSPLPSPSPTSEPAPAETEPAEGPSPTVEPEPTDTETVEPDETETAPNGAGTVVVIGDSHSIDNGNTWVDPAADALDWGTVVNLSSPGRGYFTTPRSCDFTPCGDFRDSIPLIVEADPDVVITFGGVADGDYSITDEAATYFAALRDALPEAEIVGIAPVTSADEAAYWLTLHGRSVQAAVEAVDGTFVNPGQPGVGDGESLSAEAQQAIADAVVEALAQG